MENRRIVPKLSRSVLALILALIHVIAISLTQFPAPYVYADEINLKLYAKAAVLMDADTGRVLYERNAHEALPMASTTKIMTLIVTLENANLEDTVDVSSYAASMPKVHLGMKSGEQYRLKDLVYSLMLESHNDSAVAIAEHVGGSVEQFAALMNQKAGEIGCENTYYITPNGLDATNGDKVHSTTARDLALVMSYCITESPKKEMFLEITREPSYTFTDISGKRRFSCINHNAFLSMMTGALSGKTGFTGNAGYCYVGALRQDGKTFVVALLACGWPNNKTYKWADTRVLMEYGLKHYNYRTFDEVQIPTEATDSIFVHHAKSDSMGSVEKVEVEMLESTGIEGLLLREDEKVTVTLYKVREMTAPIAKGEVIGYISYTADNKEWKRITLVTAEGKEAIDFEWCFQQVFTKWLINNK